MAVSLRVSKKAYNNLNDNISIRDQTIVPLASKQRPNPLKLVGKQISGSEASSSHPNKEIDTSLLDPMVSQDWAKYTHLEINQDISSVHVGLR